MSGNRNIFRKIRNKTRQPKKQPDDGQISRPSRSIRGAEMPGLSRCKAALQVTAPFRLADRVEQGAPSEPKPTLLQVTALQLLPDSDIGGRMSKNKAASCLCIATKTSGYPLRLSPEGGMLACRGRTMANKTKGQDHSGTPPTSRAKARRRLKLARASTEREGCRFQGRRSRGWCNDPYITRSTLSTGDEGTYDQRRI